MTECHYLFTHSNVINKVAGWSKGLNESLISYCITTTPPPPLPPENIELLTGKVQVAGGE